MNIIKMQTDDVMQFIKGTRIIDYKDMILESSYPLQSTTGVYLLGDDTNAQLLYEWCDSYFVVVYRTSDGFTANFDAMFDENLRLLIHRKDENLDKRVTENSLLGLVLIILFIENFILNPKQILRASLNTTHKCSNKHRKQLYRALSIAQIKYEPTVTKGHHRSPAFEFEVRGHWRTYKNGRRVWIKPYTKCEGKGKKLTHEYILLN